MLLPVEKFLELCEKKTPSLRFTKGSVVCKRLHCVYFMDSGKLKAHPLTLFALASGKLSATFVIYL